MGKIAPADVFELPHLDCMRGTHKNYGVIMRSPLLHAHPQGPCVWEMVDGGVNGIGTAIPGGFHAWVALDILLHRKDIMCECRKVLEMLVVILKAFASESASLFRQSPSSSSLSVTHSNGVHITETVPARIGTGSASVSAFNRQPSSAAILVSCISNPGSADSVYARVGVERGCRACVSYATNFRRLELIRPTVFAPLDEILTHLGRLSKQPGRAKKPLSPDTTQSVAWHAKIAEGMFRGWCQDRDLGDLLGVCVQGKEKGS